MTPMVRHQRPEAVRREIRESYLGQLRWRLSIAERFRPEQAVELKKQIAEIEGSAT